jgi:protein tyrosine/serine phosphatase
MAGAQAAKADLQRFLEVAPGVYRGDQPDELSDYQALRSYGVRTIVNLRKDRSVDKEREVAGSLGIDVVNVPMSGASYPSDASVERALSVVTDSHAQPVYVHCQFGKDRTGLIMALYRVRYQGWPRKQAYREWVDMGFSQVLVNLSSYFYLHTPDTD